MASRCSLPIRHLILFLEEVRLKLSVFRFRKLIFIVNDWICGAFINCKTSDPVPIVRSSIAGYENCGFGRIIELENPISLQHAAELLKKYLKLQNCIINFNLFA